MDGGSLKRHLGLVTVMTVSIGAMIGSGIFVLPDLALEVTGPSVALAYLLAGLLVVPAALSKSEMATAMPEAGGTYLYIDRALGPMLGTIAGFGAWFSLVFKSAFALVGLGAYVTFFADADPRLIGLTITIVLIALNVLGVRESAGVQSVLVALSVAALVVFVGLGADTVEPSDFTPMLPDGYHGLLAATGLVFVAYAGVTKVASIAEEVRDPGRNLPRAILLSIAIMVLVYPAVVAVIVGATDGRGFGGSYTPITDAADAFTNRAMVDVFEIVAVLALVSMANAGLLSSSRYPFAMARNALAPGTLMRLSSRGMPVVSIVVTGAAILLLIAFVPLIELAKLASAFQLLLFSLVNLALIAFRESRLRWYKPTFRSPLYPWIQVAGIAGSVVLLTQMGWESILGAAGIVVGGWLWYQVFGRTRASRESASLDALRIRENSRLVAMTEMALRDRSEGRLLVPLFGTPRESRRRDLLRLAKSFTGHDGEIVVAWFATPAEIKQANLAGAGPTPEQIVGHDAESMGVDITLRRVAGDNRRAAIADYVWNHGITLVLAEMPQDIGDHSTTVLDLKWLRDNVECDTVFLRNRALDRIDSIVIMGSGGPFDVLKISLANRVARTETADLRFVHVVNEATTEAQLTTIKDYHEKLEELTTVRTVSDIKRSEELVPTLHEAARGANLVVIGSQAQRFRVFSNLADRIAEDLDVPTLLVHATDSHRRTLRGRLFERLLY